ncbi:MAG: ribbon-helix-helix protein, CopG family [Ornithinimicrobium sp.]|uniref:ribbon-helix-helix protein, CopG family n=1 Tax=Ornithinimicrobium sp. TaxID=1977084 RepID=UPI003D9B75D2
MTSTTGASETWQARVPHDLAAQLRRDAELLGLQGRTEIVRAALELLHRQAAQERMAQSVEHFYGSEEPPLPVGVRSRAPTETDVTA